MRVFLFGLLLICETVTATQPVICEKETPERLSAKQMSETICSAAERGQIKVSTSSMLAHCGAGIMESAKIVGQGLYDGAAAIANAGSSVASKSAAWVHSFWRESDDAALAAEKTAEANSQEAKSWLQTVSAVGQASRLLMDTYIADFDHNVRLIAGAVPCLPMKMQIKLFCQFVSYVALDFMSCQAVAKAGEKSIVASRAVAEFMRKANLVEELRGVGVAARLKAAGAALESQSQYKLVEKFGEVGNLRERIDPITQVKNLHFEEIASRDGKKISVIRDIARDAKTGAIDANFEYGQRLARLTAEKSKGDHLLFMDVNNLGKVNYFKDGTQAGDKYLTAVGKSIQSHLRAEDRFFKNGGDELVVVLKTKDPEEVKTIIKRIHKSIDEDKALQDLFKQERAAVAAKIKQENKLTGSPPHPDQIKALQDTAKIRPSLSIGSTKIQGDWAADLGRAEKQAGEIKALYKGELGDDISKYKKQGLTLPSGPPRFNVKPMVLEPAL